MKVMDLDENAQDIEINIDGKRKKLKNNEMHKIWFGNVTYGDIISALGSFRRTGLTFHTNRNEAQKYTLDIHGDVVTSFERQYFYLWRRLQDVGAKTIHKSDAGIHIAFVG